LVYYLRRMERNDLAQVNKIDREAFPTQWPPANYRQELNNKMAYYIVARDDERAGEDEDEETREHRARLAWLLPWAKHRQLEAPPPVRRDYIVGFSGIWLMVDEAHITNIAVRQEYQGRGIGEMLLIVTIDMSLELEARVMTLEVRASNQVAQNLYSKYGFVEMGRRRGYYLDNREDAVIMSTESIAAATFQQRLNDLRQALRQKLAWEVARLV
jgi:ribosomal-protein-alanine N-acetyltransferase